MRRLFCESATRVPTSSPGAGVRRFLVSLNLSVQHRSLRGRSGGTESVTAALLLAWALHVPLPLVHATCSDNDATEACGATLEACTTSSSDPPDVCDCYSAYACCLVDTGHCTDADIQGAVDDLCVAAGCSVDSCAAHSGLGWMAVVGICFAVGVALIGLGWLAYAQLFSADARARRLKEKRRRASRQLGSSSSRRGSGGRSRFAVGEAVGDEVVQFNPAMGASTSATPPLQREPKARMKHLRKLAGTAKTANATRVQGYMATGARVPQWITKGKSLSEGERAWVWLHAGYSAGPGCCHYCGRYMPVDGAWTVGKCRWNVCARCASTQPVVPVGPWYLR